MAGEFQKAWEKQKKENPYLTLSNASTLAKPTTGGTTTTPNAGGTIKTSTGGSAAANIYKSLLNGKTAPKLTYTAPTAVPTKAESAIKAKEEYNYLAADAYKRKLAEQQAAQQATQESTEEKDNTPIIPPSGNQGLQQPAVEDPFAEEDAIDPLEAYLERILAAQAAQSAAQQQMIKNQMGVLNEQYDNNAANLYARYRRSGLAMPEQMAGTATGIADSFVLQNDLNFQNDLTENELARAAAQNELQAQLNQIQADAEMQAAQTAADWAQMAYQQRLANQNNGGGTTGGGTTSGGTSDDNNTSGSGSLPGVTGSVSAMTKDEVIKYLTNRFYTALTPDNITKALNQLMDKGLPESVARAVGENYGMEML